jgi:hypothetical protein
MDRSSFIVKSGGFFQPCVSMSILQPPCIRLLEENVPYLRPASLNNVYLAQKKTTSEAREKHGKIKNACTPGSRIRLRTLASATRTSRRSRGRKMSFWMHKGYLKTAPSFSVR